MAYHVICICCLKLAPNDYIQGNNKARLDIHHHAYTINWMTSASNHILILKGTKRESPFFHIYFRQLVAHKSVFEGQ